MPRPVAIFALSLAVHAFAGSGEGTVLCVGDSGHQRIEPATATCCIDPPSGRESGRGWSGDGPCGPCTDYPNASAALSSDSRARSNRDHGLLESARACRAPELFLEASFLTRRSRPGEHLSARIPSTLRV